MPLAASSEIDWIDDRTFEIHITHDRYFAGPLGRLVAEATGGTAPLAGAQPVRRHGLTVLATQHDEAGVSALRFALDRPPGQSGVHLFWGSQTRWAAELTPPCQKP